MKLQLSLVALSLTSLCLAGKLPLPKVKEQTQKKLNNLERNVHNKIQSQMKEIGMSFDTKKLSSKNLGNAVEPQLASIEREATKQYNKLNKQFGGLSLGGIFDAIKNKANAGIEEAEEGVPDGAKQFIDIGQELLGAVVDAGANALGDHKKLTVNNIVNSGKNFAEGAINGKKANSALRKANKLVNE